MCEGEKHEWNLFEAIGKWEIFISDSFFESIRWVCFGIWLFMVLLNVKAGDVKLRKEQILCICKIWWLLKNVFH